MKCGCHFTKTVYRGIIIYTTVREVSPWLLTKKGTKQIAANKKAWHDYFVEEKYEAGIELAGTEVKSIRLGQINLNGFLLFVQGR